LGGIAAREQTQNLGLTRCQVRWDRMFLGGLSDIGKLAEDTDASVALHQGDRADVDADPFAVSAQEHGLGVGDLRGPGDLAREFLAGAPRVLGGDNRRELSPADIADEPLRSWIDPTDDAGRTDDVARDVDAFQ